MPSWAGSVTVVSRTATVKPASSSASCASAAGTGFVVTSGTSTSGGALATTIATVLPGATLVPLAGSCSSTSPSSASVVSRSVTSATRPTAASARSAEAREEPTTSGTVTGSAPRETTSVTSVPRSTTVPSGGAVSITRPLSTSPEYWRCRLTSKPASRRAASAASAGCPATPGTGASPGPPDTVMVTVEPSSACSPPAGSCVTTRSRATSSDWTVLICTSKPRSCSVCAAASPRCPVTSGTVSVSGRSRR